MTEISTGRVNGFSVIYIDGKTYYATDAMNFCLDRIAQLERIERKYDILKDSCAGGDLKEQCVAAIEKLATKLESIADRAEQKGEFTTYETNRVEANRLYAAWLRTMAHGAPVASGEIGAGIAAYEKELRDAVIEECLQAVEVSIPRDIWQFVYDRLQELKKVSQ